MNKLFSITLLFTSFSFAEIDIGDDFVAGDLISAEEFNQKFGKLKKVVTSTSSSSCQITLTSVIVIVIPCLASSAGGGLVHLIISFLLI